MAVTPSQDLARLLRLLNQPGLTNLPAQNATSGEVQIIAVGPNPMDQVRLVMDSGRIYNLLEYAPQSWWAVATTLVFAVEQQWVLIPDPNAPTTVLPPSQTTTAPNYLVAPANPNIGDMLVWNGAIWALLTPGTSTYVLTSNGPGVIPSYQPVAGGGGGSDIITGQTTTGLADGDFGYVSANNTWLKTRSDGSLQQATAQGVNLGTSGSMAIGGRITSAKFTTVGGAPSPGAQVFLAANADDGGTGAGKLTATPPTSGFLTVAGVCLDNTNYGALKTVVVLFNPRSPIQLT